MSFSWCTILTAVHFTLDDSSPIVNPQNKVSSDQYIISDQWCEENDQWPLRTYPMCSWCPTSNDYAKEEHGKKTFLLELSINTSNTSPCCYRKLRDWRQVLIVTQNVSWTLNRLTELFLLPIFIPHLWNRISFGKEFCQENEKTYRPVTNNVLSIGILLRREYFQSFVARSRCISGKTICKQERERGWGVPQPWLGEEVLQCLPGRFPRGELTGVPSTPLPLPCPLPSTGRTWDRALDRASDRTRRKGNIFSLSTLAGGSTLSQVWKGGYPIPGLDGGGWYPIPGPDWGYPTPGPGGVTPSQVWMGVLHPRSRWGWYPILLTGGYPHPRLDGVLPSASFIKL